MKDENRKNKLKAKILIVGEPGAGKSFIAKSTDACLPVRKIGASIGKIFETFSNLSCDMTLITWAITKGRPRKSTHIKNSDAAVIVCDLTRPDTVDQIPQWANSILDIDGDIPLFFVANNAEAGTSDTKKRFRGLAWEFKSPCYLIKSGDQTSIRNIFRAIAKKLSENIMNIVYVDYEEENNLVSW